MVQILMYIIKHYFGVHMVMELIISVIHGFVNQYDIGSGGSKQYKKDETYTERDTDFQLTECKLEYILL